MEPLDSSPLTTHGQDCLQEAGEAVPAEAVFLGRFAEEEFERRPPRPRNEAKQRAVEECFPPCYCITGHGRSGTSLIASLLQSGGLSIGKRLMGPGEGNVCGHFEDLDFYDFHVAVLTEQGFGSEGYVVQPSIAVPNRFLATAGALVAARREAGKPWGWKDPRATLFLDFWHELIPELRFLLLFRSPWEVADSLFRRGDAHFVKNPNLVVKVWQNYNQALINFHDRFPRRCLLVESQAAAVAPQRLTQMIADSFGDHFGPLDELFEKDLFQHDTTARQRSVIEHFFPEAVDLYYQLRVRASLVHRTWEAPPPTPVDAPDHDWALQHWVDFRLAEKNWKRTKSELEKEQAASQVAQARAAQELDHARAEVNLWQGEAAKARALVSWMESSKFWKLRRLWMRLKQHVGP